MIIRKPYAFLIKHFRKIHVLLLILSAFVYYKNLQLSSFVREFIQLETYDIYNEPITEFVSFLPIFSMVLLSLGSIVLMLLLYYKKKPWKLYLLPVFEYIFMIIVFLSTKSFFDQYNGIVDSASIRAIRDFLLISSFLQYPTMILLLIRSIGVDLNKFNFKLDEEFLEFSNADREEFEINIEFDKDSIKRSFKKFLRNASYAYQEHKLIYNILASVIFIIVLFGGYKSIFITNKTYKQGEALNANGYTITINKSYYTDKDYAGKKISDKSAFVIVNLTIKNNDKQRVVDLQKFHIRNGVNGYVTTDKIFETEFQDFGVAFKSLELKNNASQNFIMIFKVDKKENKNRYVLYYQEFHGDTPHLRKIKLNLEDVSEIKDAKTLTLGEELSFNMKEQTENIIFDDYEILDNTEYSYRNCSGSNCTTKTGTYSAAEGYKILKITFSSNNFEGKDMIDFSTKYGRIDYIDDKNKIASVAIKNPFNKTYHGKYLYVRIPVAAANSHSIELSYTIRNNRYIYKIR